MVRSTISLGGYKLQALNGELIGRVNDFLFDDRKWVVRYLVLRTGGWFTREKKLISPVALGEPDWSSLTIPAKLSVKQVKESPDISVDRPVSLQQEIELHEYYDWLPYWLQEGSAAEPASGHGDTAGGTGSEEEDRHLRSALEVLTYELQAEDGKAGRIKDLLIEDGTWVIRYLVVKTSFWKPARRVLVSPLWMRGASWEQKKIYVDMPLTIIRNSPRYDPSAPLNKEFETRLYDHYGKPKDW